MYAEISCGRDAALRQRLEYDGSIEPGEACATVFLLAVNGTEAELGGRPQALGREHLLEDEVGACYCSGYWNRECLTAL